MKSHGVGSVASEATRKIRADILSGHWPPGSRLTEVLLAERYQVSRMPIRESLRSLSAEGLVELRPYEGARVANLPEEDAEDLFAIRAELEAATARRATLRGREQLAKSSPDESWWRVRKQLYQVLSEGEEALAGRDFSQLAQLNSRFHRGVAALSNSASLIAIFELIEVRIEWLYTINLAARGIESWPEHHAIMSAIDAGHAEVAVEKMRSHVERSAATYFNRATLNSNPSS